MWACTKEYTSLSNFRCYFCHCSRYQIFLVNPCIMLTQTFYVQITRLLSGLTIHRLFSFYINKVEWMNNIPANFEEKTWSHVVHHSSRVKHTCDKSFDTLIRVLSSVFAKIVQKWYHTIHTVQSHDNFGKYCGNEVKIQRMKYSTQLVQSNVQWILLKLHIIIYMNIYLQHVHWYQLIYFIFFNSNNIILQCGRPFKNTYYILLCFCF